MIVKGGNIPKKGIHNILIIQLGDIGDVVWATPTFRAIKKAYPTAGINILVREGSGSLLEEDPMLDKIFEVRSSASKSITAIRKQLQLIRVLRRERFDLVFDLRSDDRGAITAFLTGAARRVGMFYGGTDIPFWRNHLFTHLVDPPPPRERILGAAEQSLRIIREFGITSEDSTPKLQISAATVNRARQIVGNGGLRETGRWVSINPFSRWQYKEWGYHNWIRIVDWLWSDLGIASVLIGSPGERDKATRIADNCRGHIINIAGLTSLKDLAGVLSLSSFHIGVDSAGPHIAAAMGTPTVTIYGPSDWREWAPVGSLHQVITPDCPCVPCCNKGCDGSERSKCLEKLDCETVKTGIRNALSLPERQP